MKRIIFLLILVVLLSSCTEPEPFYRKINNETKTFSIKGEDKLGWIDESAEKRADLNKMSYTYNEEAEEEERLKKAEAKYWTREFDGETYFGYDEELDKGNNFY